MKLTHIVTGCYKINRQLSKPPRPHNPFSLFYYFSLRPIYNSFYLSEWRLNNQPLAGKWAHAPKNKTEQNPTKVFGGKF